MGGGKQIDAAEGKCLSSVLGSRLSLGSAQLNNRCHNETEGVRGERRCAALDDGGTRVGRQLPPLSAASAGPHSALLSGLASLLRRCHGGWACAALQQGEGEGGIWGGI